MATDITPVSAADGERTNNVVALPHRAEPTRPSDKAIQFVKEHPVLTVAGGLAVGLAISALIPRSFTRRLAKRAYNLAEAGAGTVFALGQDAADKAEDGTAAARKKAAILAKRAERLGEKAAARAEILGEKALSKAERLGVAALGTAGALGHAAADRAERLGHVAADRAEVYGTRASERLSQLGDKALGHSGKLIGYPRPAETVADRLLEKAHGLKARLHS